MPTTSIEDSGTKNDFRAYLVLCGLVLAAFLPSALDADFLNFDDNRFFGLQADRPAEERDQLGTSEPDFAGSELEAAGFWGLLDPTERIVDAYLPVSHASLELDRQLFGQDPLGPHLHSLFLHLLATGALLWMLRTLGLDLPRAAIAAGLFAVHPALDESVLWVSGRKDLLSGLFAFLSLGLLVRAVRPRAEADPASKRVAIAAAITAVLAVYAKGTAIVLAPVAPVLALAVGARGKALMPAFAITAVGTLAALHHQSLAAEAGTLVDRPLSDTLPQVPSALVHYLKTSVWPADLDVIYPERRTLAGFADSVVWSTVILALVAALALSAWVLGHRRAALGAALFFVVLAPFNTAFPATSLAAADRYLYLALPALAVAVVSIPRVGLPLGAVALLPLLVGSHLRARDFEDSAALWTASLERDAENAVAANNLAEYRYRRLVAGGSTVLEIRDELQPLLESARDADAYPNQRARAASDLSTIAEQAHDYPSAAQYAREAAQAYAEMPETELVRGLRLQLRLTAARLARRAGDGDFARAQLGFAATLAPEAPIVRSWQLADRLAEIAADHDGKVPADDPRTIAGETELGSIEQALEEVEKGLGGDQVALGRYEFHLVRGDWRRARGRVTAAGADYKRSIALDPRRPEAHLARVDLYLAQRDFAAEAERGARQALRLGVSDPRLRMQLASALASQGRMDEARRYFELYLELRPEDERATKALALILGALGDRDLEKLEPEELLARAYRILELDPSSLPALKMRAVGYMKTQRHADALDEFRKLRAQLPEDPEILRLFSEALRNRGYALALGGQASAAEPVFREFLRVAPPEVDTQAVESLLRQADQREWERRIELAQQALQEQKPVVAETELRRCLELRPGVEQIRFQLGLALLEQGGRAEEALEEFLIARRHAEKTGGDPTRCVLYQMRTLVQLDRAEEAVELGTDYVLDPPETADPVQVQRIRQMLTPR